MTLEALPNTIYWKKEKRKGIKMGDKDENYEVHLILPNDNEIPHLAWLRKLIILYQNKRKSPKNME